MNLQRDRRAIELLDQVLELPQHEVPGFLDRCCGEDSQLRNKIETLMLAMDQGNSFLASQATSRSASSQPGPSRLDSRLPLGSLVADRYAITDKIGSGGMGEVYRATDTRLDRAVALKTLNDASRSDEGMRSRFLREAKSVAALMHPNIVALFDVLTHDETDFAVMELVEGNTLRQLIDQQLDLMQAIEIARDVATGLDAAHRQDLMHRDIKPENIVVTSQRDAGQESRAKILDFGLARRQDGLDEQRLTMSAATPGTIPYMSPEQAEGLELTCATDIFSLGTVLYEMVTGKNPFRDETALRTMRRVSEASPPPLSQFRTDLPEPLVELVAAMFSLSPEARPSAQQVGGRLEMMIDTSVKHTPLTTTAKPSVETPVEAGSQSNGQPSLIVLPFQVFGDQSLEPVADGLVENLTTVLTRIPLLSLTSRMTSFSLKGESTTAGDVRKRFGVDYMIEGSLQGVGERVRANVQLIATQSGFHLWAQQFDCSCDDALGGELLASILYRLEPQLSRAIFNDLGGDGQELSGRQLLIRANSLLSVKGWHRDSFREVADMLRLSIEREPGIALTHAHLALTRGLGKRVGLMADPEAAEKEAIEHAERAMDLDDLDSNVLGLAGCALSDVGQMARAVPILKNAIDLNPMNAQAHAALGAAYLPQGKLSEAAENLTRGIELSPADGRLAVWYALLALTRLLQEDSDAALEAANRGCQSDRKSYLPRVIQTVIHLARGEQDTALEMLRETLRVKPDLSKGEIEHLVGREWGIAVRKLQRLL